MSSPEQVAPPGGPPGPPGPPGSFGPPPGFVSNPAESRHVNIIVAAVLCWVIAAIFVGLRFYARVGLIKTSIIAEDWFVVASLVFSAAMSGTFITQAKFGAGRHILDIPPEHYAPSKKGEFLGMVWYVMSLVLIKISICLLYLRILRFRHARYVIWVLLAVVVLFSLWGLYGIFTACRPLWAFWTPPPLQPPNTTCRGSTDWIINTSLHVATDVIMYILPLPLVVKIKAATKQKIAIYAVVALGLFVCIVSAVRLWDFARVFSTVDVSWEAVSIAYWSLVEVNASIVVACTMALRPVVKRWFPHGWGSWTDRFTGRKQYGGQTAQSNITGGGGANSRAAKGDLEMGRFSRGGVGSRNRELDTIGSWRSKTSRIGGRRLSGHDTAISAMRSIDEGEDRLVPGPKKIYATTTITATHEEEHEKESFSDEGRSSSEDRSAQQHRHYRAQSRSQVDAIWPVPEPPQTYQPGHGGKKLSR